MKQGLREIHVLGTPVHACTYATALDAAKTLARSGKPAKLSACNTHLVALARHDESFGRIMQDFDLVLPDGYPLVWAINHEGEKLQDRVYGPYFMKYAIENAPAPWRHFFFGGTPETLERLVASARSFNPQTVIAGTLSPPFRAWTGKDEEDFAATIKAADADFVWVALGGERQERWIARNLHRHSKGVFCAVGDAFELLAGTRPFAPAWMQKHGLTWLYRLCQEPRRLWLRYAKFNSLFLFYALRDSVLPRRGGPQPRIAFLGSRGVPARYSGFETVVEKLGSRLAVRGYEVTVYNRFPHATRGLRRYEGMHLVTLPTIPTKSLDTIVHTALSSLHAVLRRYDLIYLCGVGNAVLGVLLRAAGMRVVLNVDGADFRRAKWGTFARLWLRTSELLASHCADIVIADNREIVRRYAASYKVTPQFLSYGAIIRSERVDCGELARWGLEPRKYILFVSRLTPENEAEILLEAYARWHGGMKLVICGSTNYETQYYKKLRALAVDGVIFTGARFEEAYWELSQKAAFFVMPAAIEATRLVLLDQMGMGAAILYRDVPATREVIDNAGEPFDSENPVASLCEKIELLASNQERCAELRKLSLRRAEEAFSWREVTDEYEKLFASLGVATK